jgi:DNA mismatch repair ATPase MutS
MVSEYNEKELVIKKEFDERLKLAENIIQEKNDYISKLESKLEKLESMPWRRRRSPRNR